MRTVNMVVIGVLATLLLYGPYVYGSRDGPVVVATIPLSSPASSVALNALNSQVYVAQRNGTVSVIDGFSDTVTATVPVGREPRRLAINPLTNRIYVPNSRDGTVSAIDGNTDSVIASAWVGGWPTFALSLGSERLNRDRVYVSTYHGAVHSIHGRSHGVVATVHVDGSNAYQMVLNPITRRLYVPDGSAVSVIDVGTNSIIASIPVCGRTVGDSPTVAVQLYPGVRLNCWTGPFAINTLTDRIFVTRGFQDLGVSVIDGASNAIISTIDLGGAPRGVAVNPFTNRIYVPHHVGPNGMVAVIDGASNTILESIPIGYPGSPVVNPLTNRVYVSNTIDATVTVIDGVSNTVIDTIPVGEKGIPAGDWAGVGPVNAITDRVYVVVVDHWYPPRDTNRIVIIADGDDHATESAHRDAKLVEIGRLVEDALILSSDVALNEQLETLESDLREYWDSVGDEDDAEALLRRGIQIIDRLMGD